MEIMLEKQFHDVFDFATTYVHKHKHQATQQQQQQS